MRKKGFHGIGCFGMKTEQNYGTLFRTAQILNADFVFLIGCRFKMQASDTCKSWRNMPVFEYKDFADFQNHRPFAAQLVGIELDARARPLKNYVHPKQAIYLLGAEDNGLPAEVLSACQDIIQLPGDNSLNVSVAGSIVLYDRYAKTLNPPSKNKTR